MKLRSDNQDLFVEFKEHSMHVIDADFGLEIPLERDAAGRLTKASAENASLRLREFFLLHGRMTPRVACCSIPARGVSLRRLGVPALERSEARRLLGLQLETQLPIAPNELAWGCSPLERNGGPGDGSGLQNYLVVAVKRDVLQDYTGILANAGVAAEYTISALARRVLCPEAAGEFSVVDAGRSRMELATFDARGPLSLRVVTGSVENLNGQAGHGKIFVTGESESALRLKERLGLNTEVLGGEAGPGRTAANEGLRKLVEGGERPILLGGYEPVPPGRASRQWKWPALAAVLLFLVIALRYAESIIYRGRLHGKLAAISLQRASLPKVEREFAFLNFIKTNQPPYIDALTVLAQSAPPGTRIDTLSFVRSGDLSLRGSVGEAKGPGEFRSKLIESGFFSRVVLEEQAPTSDGQKFTFRLSAQLKPDGARKPVNLAPTSK